MGIFDFIKNNLSHVLPILLCAGFAIAIIFERYKALFNVYAMKDGEQFIHNIHGLVVARKIKDAILLCDQNGKKPLSHVVKSALQRANMPDEASEQAAMISLGENSRMLQSRTNFLATIANIVTLLGLLGTIAGLIQSFEAVGHADPSQKSALLSAGIATAMNATMMGLGVAIPCMVAYSFFINRTNRMIAELEDGAMKTIDALKIRYFTEEMNEDKQAS